MRTAFRERAVARAGVWVGGLLTLLASGMFVLAVFGAASASARTVTTYAYSGQEFNGAGSTAGAFTKGIAQIAINQANGNLFVIDREGGGVVSQFTSSGAPVNFPALGASSIVMGAAGESDIAVDNSSSTSADDFYAAGEGSPLHGYEPDGTELHGNFPLSGLNHSCGVAVDSQGNIWIADTNENELVQFSPQGIPTGKRFFSPSPCHFAIDGNGNFYVIQLDHTNRFHEEQIVRKYNPEGNYLYDLNAVVSNAVAVDPSTNNVFVDVNVPFFPTQIDEFDEMGNPITSFGTADPSHSFDGLGESQESGGPGTSLGLTVDATTHDVYATQRGNGGSGPYRVVKFAPGGTITVPTVATKPAEVTTSGATLKGIVNADGVPTTHCTFQWGLSTASPYVHTYYENSAPCNEGNTFSGSSDNSVTATLTGLPKGTTYHYRITAENSNGVLAVGADKVFRPQGPPMMSNVTVSEVRTGSAQVNFDADPNGGLTHFHINWGTTEAYGHRTPIRDVQLSSTLGTVHMSQVIPGLAPGTSYHFRVVLENDVASAPDVDHVFQTFPSDSVAADSCANVRVRQQTSAARLLDCRAYELVSAANTGGYDVQSDLIPGQSMLPAYPDASNKVLYSMHDGAIPGIGDPTNLGLDPYIASRGENGWTTNYVGVPANDPNSTLPFSSVPSGADEGLGTFAFGGSGGCSPCFSNGSTGIPVRLPDGSLVQGMVASPSVIAPGTNAKPDGYIAKDLSANGAHLIFGSSSRFAPGGNDGTGDVSIYDRNLKTGETHTVSFDPAGDPLVCLQGAGACHSPGNGNGIAELDLSSDGSRIILGQKVATDTAGNVYWHLYMNIGDSEETIDLTPGATHGVLYDGMTADGSKVFFTTSDRLLPSEDTDGSADIYEADIAPNGTVTDKLVSTGSGGTGNGSACSPPGNWNTVSGGPNCNAVAFAGGAGVASGDGTFYFLSPELLDGASNGTQDQPNLYVVRSGSTPHFVATIDSSLTKPPPAPPSHPLLNASFGPAFGNAQGVAVDQSDEDIYVVDTGSGSIDRLHSSGLPDNFTAGANVGTNTLTGFSFDGPSASQVAVDNSGGSFNGHIYVASFAGISIFGSDGASLGTLNGAGTNGGAFGEACGVAIDQSNGDVYVGDYSGQVWRYAPSNTALPITDADYTVTGITTTGINPCNVAADSIGHVYATGWPSGPLNEYDASAFASGVPPSPTAKQISASSTAVATDPDTNEVYVDQGNKIALFDSSGAAITTFGAGNVPGSLGVAVDSSNGRVYASSNGTKLVSFDRQPTPYTPIDDPAVVHAVQQAGTHNDADFQISPDGDFAAFSSSQSLTGYANRGNFEIYRYDARGSGQLDCASCAPTGAAATSDTTLSSEGLNLTDDGRVFFTTAEQLVLRDTNNVKDAYEWENGVSDLISSGSSQFDSGLLSVTANGTDAFFVTRQVLAPQDGNGSVLKIYDARAAGGFLFEPPPVPCKASDECHGPGTVAAPPPAIGTYKGTGGNVVPKKKPGKHHHHRRRHHHKRDENRRHG